MCAASFCISTKALFTLLTFSSFTVFLSLRSVVASFASSLAWKFFWLTMWSTSLDSCSLSLSSASESREAAQVPGDAICMCLILHNCSEIHPCCFVLVVHYFLLLSSILLYGYTTNCLSTHLLIDMLVRALQRNRTDRIHTHTLTHLL